MIIFKNEGLMPLEAATTFGLNAKVGENPIGFFGTGLKYAIAITLRLGGTFRLFLGEIEYEFYVKTTDFRGKDFDVIRMKKRKSRLGRWSYQALSFTTELGKHWEPWMAVRELESNMRDEVRGSSCDYSSSYDVAQQLFPCVDYTVIMIECPEMEEAYDNLDQIFMPEKKLLFENSALQIFEGQSDYIFYRGLRVTDIEDRPSLFTYNFTLGVALTEDRTSKWTYIDRSTIMGTWLDIQDQEMMEQVMSADEDKNFEGILDWDTPYTTPGTTYMGELGRRIMSGEYIPKRMRTYHTEIHKDTDEESIDVPLMRGQIEWLIENIEGNDPIINILKESIY